MKPEILKDIKEHLELCFDENNPDELRGVFKTLFIYIERLENRIESLEKTRNIIQKERESPLNLFR